MPETQFYGVKLLYRYEVCGEVFYEESILTQTSHTQKSHEAPKVGQKRNKKIA